MRAFALLLAGAAAAAAFAQEEFVPGSENTLSWVEPAEGFKQMLKELAPGILYFYSAGKADFCKALERDVIPAKALAKEIKKFVCMKLSSDKESDLLKKYKLEAGAAAVLFLDSQGNAVETIAQAPDVNSFSSALRKAQKASQDVKKFLSQVETLYKEGEAYLKREMYLKATEDFQAILEARDEFEKKKGRVESAFFEKAQQKIEKIKEEGTKLLIKANAAAMNNDFNEASLILSRLRVEFVLFEDIIKKVEQAEQDLQAQMQRANPPPIPQPKKP